MVMILVSWFDEVKENIVKAHCKEKMSFKSQILKVIIDVQILF